MLALKSPNIRLGNSVTNYCIFFWKQLFWRLRLACSCCLIQASVYLYHLFLTVRCTIYLVFAKVFNVFDDYGYMGTHNFSYLPLLCKQCLAKAVWSDILSSNYFILNTEIIITDKVLVLSLCITDNITTPLMTFVDFMTSLFENVYQLICCSSQNLLLSILNCNLKVHL